MNKHFKIILGTWMIEDWHLYRYRQHRNKTTGMVRWWMWDKII